MILDQFLCTGRMHSLLCKVFRCCINIQKDANERKLTQAGRTNVAVYTCTKFVLRFVYVDTNNSVRSWQILYMNHILWYVNGNAGKSLL